MKGTETGGPEVASLEIRETERREPSASELLPQPIAMFWTIAFTFSQADPY